MYIKRGGHKMKQIRQPIKDAVRYLHILVYDDNKDSNDICFLLILFFLFLILIYFIWR